MGRAWRVLLAAKVGYLLGTIPSADVAARLATRGTVDLRAAGSGNPGALNAINVLGKRWGVAVAVADVTKGVAAGFAGRAIAGDAGAYAAGTAAIAGHIAPVWRRGSGGKGVATSIGSMGAVFPAWLPAHLAITFGGTRVFRNTERATWIGNGAWVGAAAVFAWRRWPNLWGPRPSPGLVLASVAGAGMVLAKFRAVQLLGKPGTVLIGDTTAAAPAA